LACELDHRGKDAGSFGSAVTLGGVGQGSVTDRQAEYRVAAHPGDTNGGRRSVGVGDDDEPFPASAIDRVDPNLRGCFAPPLQELGAAARIELHLEGDLIVANARGIEGHDIGPGLERGSDSPFELGKGWNKQQPRRCTSGSCGFHRVHSVLSRHRLVPQPGAFDGHARPRAF
jgi:hypothetical protein